MRTRLPDLRTLPSSTVATLSFCATVGMSTSLPLKENAEVRDATRKPADLRQHVQQFFRQPVGEVLVLLVAAHVENGSTAIEGISLSAGAICDLSGGKLCGRSGWQSWNTDSGRPRSFRPWEPSALTLASGGRWSRQRSCVDSERSVWPP